MDAWYSVNLNPRIVAPSEAENPRLTTRFFAVLPRKDSSERHPFRTKSTECKCPKMSRYGAGPVIYWAGPASAVAVSRGNCLSPTARMGQPPAGRP